jgi:hypothetical protein
MRGGTQLVETDTNLDTDGDVIKVLPPAGETGSQSPVGRHLEAQSAWSFERFEQSNELPIPGLLPSGRPPKGRGIAPLDVQGLYAGKTNERTFLNYPRGEVLCESVSFDNTGLGDVAWRMIYEFRRRSNSVFPGVVRGDAWATLYSWTDAETGYPKVGTDGEVSANLIYHQGEVDFNRLRFGDLQ